MEGKVERVVKGGYEVRDRAPARVLPVFQIDITRTAEPAVHVGRVYTFRIVEYSDDGRNLVVSRRALLDEEQRAKEAEVRRADLPARWCEDGLCRCATSARSSIWAAASRACSMCPRWGGRA